jgi:erythronate-4-phosphate dehydrogenase
MTVLHNDPPRVEKEGVAGFSSLQEICRECDIISFHTLLSRSGKYKTYHMADDKFFANIKPGITLINAARGEVIDTIALKSAIRERKIDKCVLDCWENEPNINPVLLERSLLATPHIAGYSADGKANATQICVRALSRFFELGLNDFVVELPEKKKLDKNVALQEQLLLAYPIERDSILFKKSPMTFEQQRSNYPMRRECDIK